MLQLTLVGKASHIGLWTPDLMKKKIQKGDGLQNTS